MCIITIIIGHVIKQEKGMIFFDCCLVKRLRKKHWCWMKEKKDINCSNINTSTPKNKWASNVLLLTRKSKG